MKVFKIIVVGIFGIIGFVLLFYIGLFFKLKYTWHKYVNKEVLETITNEINSSPKLPVKFYDIYNKIYPDRIDTKFAKEYFYNGPLAILGVDYTKLKHSPTTMISQMVQYQFPRTDNVKIKVEHLFFIYLSFAIDKYTTTQKCFDYMLTKFDFYCNCIGVFEASKKMYNKELQYLSDKEIVGLIAILNGSVTISPQYNPDRFEEEVMNLMKILNGAEGF